jgi:hypothetical protein
VQNNFCFIKKVAFLQPFFILGGYNMSGGYFDYVQHKIEYEVIEKLDELINSKDLQLLHQIDDVILKEIKNLQTNLKNSIKRITELDKFLESDNGKEEYLKNIKSLDILL